MYVYSNTDIFHGIDSLLAREDDVGDLLNGR